MGRLFNIARMTTATTGTGTVTLGSAVSGYITFANAGVANGDVVTYVLEEGANREIGIGTYTSSGTTLSRDTVLNSTAGGATKITLAGAANVFIDAAAQDIGRVLQVANSIVTSVGTTSTSIPFDDTIPQNTEGAEFLSQAITPIYSSSKLKIEVVLVMSPGANSLIGTVALFQDSTANALAAIGEYMATNGDYRTVAFTHFMTAGTTSSTTFKVRAGLSAGNTLTVNGLGGSRRYGGVSASSITISEIRA